ncbi:InlB B-repeat-containing protein [Candidatus Saccharibacteria bacterium]|nr:InlB B-repeat-containing protein [Candidatus Saccharibacteria bacterium]
MQTGHTKINYNKILFKILPLTALTVVVLLALFTTISVHLTPTNALTLNHDTNVSTMSVHSMGSIEMTLSSNSVALPIVPTSEGAFGKADITINVGTDNDYGYNLMMYSYAPNTTTATTDLTRTASLSDDTLPVIRTLDNNNDGSGYTCTETTASSCNFPVNRWGYKLSGTNYLPATTTEMTINANGSAGNLADNPNTVTFGAKLDHETRAGNYEIKLVFVATVNTPTIKSFNNAFDFAGASPYPGTSYYTMQDMTPFICGLVETPTTNTANVQTAQLVDTRDEKVYWVAKLMDGNCWMTQNLDLNLDTNVSLTSENTNLIAYGTDVYGNGYNHDAETGVTTWKPITSTIDAGESSSQLPDTSSTTPASISFGNWYYLRWGGEGAYSYYNSDDCGELNCDFQTGAAGADAQFSQTPGTNGEHGHVGTYHNWTSAIASNNAASLSPDNIATNSICPAGWKLPDSGDENHNGTYALLNKLYNNSFIYADMADKNLLAAPIYLLRTGTVWKNRLRNAGLLGFYSTNQSAPWSEQTQSNWNLYVLRFTNSFVVAYNIYGGGRGDFMPLRCLAISGETTVVYDGNGATEGVMPSQVIPAGSTVATTAVNYLKSGAEFTGWNTEPDGTGTTYANRAEITADSNDTVITLYAQWNDTPTTFEMAFAAAGKSKTNGYYVMQDMTADICKAVTTPASTISAPETQLLDNRDNKIYWVAKLMDGNCWMTQNLDLDLNANTTLTNADTDLNSVPSWTPVHSTINSTAYNNTATGASGGILTYNNGAQNGSFAPGWTNDNNTPYSADPGYRYVVPKFLTTPNTFFYENGDTFHYCTTQSTICGDKSENGHYTIGNYYNFAAANATNSVNNTIGHAVTNSDIGFIMPNSICPKGWRLPLGKYDNNELKILLNTNYNIVSNINYTGLNAMRRSPLYFVRTGRIDNNNLLSAGTSGNLWSNVITSSNDGRDLYFESRTISINAGDKRYNGLSVRCLARTE